MGTFHKGTQLFQLLLNWKTPTKVKLAAALNAKSLFTTIRSAFFCDINGEQSTLARVSFIISTLIAVNFK